MVKKVVGGRASRGHTNVELSKQRLRHQIAELRREIEEVLPERQKRSAEGFQVALLGYTNAGKSSLVNALTRADTHVEDKLFATLGTSTKKMTPPSEPAIFLTDTVGFIEKLPPGLIASFRSTLAEACNAWLLIKVIDASDQDWRSHIEVTTRVLQEIGLGEKNCLLLFNKIDKVERRDLREMASEFSEALFVSAVNSDDMLMLRSTILDLQHRELIECSLELSYSEYAILAEFHAHVQVVLEEFGDTVSVRVRSTADMLAKLKARLA